MSTSYYEVVTESDGVTTLIPRDYKIERTLIFLHGFAQRGSTWLNYFASGKALPKGTKVILPTAPKSYNALFKKETHSWIDFAKPHYSDEEFAKLYAKEVLSKSAEKVMNIVDKEVKELGDAKKCLIGGFSAGGIIAGYIFKVFPEALGGLILYSSAVASYIPIDEIQDFSPVFWSYGIEDTFITYSHCVKNNEIFYNGKRKITHLVREGLGHGVDNVIQAATKIFIERESPVAKL